MGLTAATAVGAANGGYQLSQAIMLVYSKEIYFWAQPVLRFDQFVVKKEELGVTPGLTMNILRYNNLLNGGILTEGTRLTTQNLSGQQLQITVVENGNAVSVSELLLQTSFDDIMASTAKLLGYDYAKVLDAQLRDQFISTSNVVYAGGVSGRNSLTSVNIFDTQVVKDAVETLKTNDAPQLAAGYYVSFNSPHQLRGMRDDPNWIAASQYGKPENLFKGEVGRYENVIFIETTQMPNGVEVSSTANPNINTMGYNPALDPLVTGALGTTVYQGVIFGDNAVGHAVSLPVEMRDNGITDFGREHGLAYYGIWGQGVLTPNNIIRIETA